MSEEHAKLSPSAADRWMVCPGSVVLSEGIPDRTSPHAEEGTIAHNLAEAMLTGKASSGSPDMILNLQVYIEHIQGLMAEHPGAQLFVEKKVSVTESLWGTADAIVWAPSIATLFVRDLKYGSGVGVEVSNNLQLKIYATAALLTLGFPAETVNVGIVQPRFNHADGPVRSKDFDASDLIDFHADLMDGVKRVVWAKQGHKATMGSPAWEKQHLHPSEKGCRWCLAAPNCPALKAKAKELTKLAFAPGLHYEPKELAAALDYAPIIEGWIKNLHEFAYAEAERGIPIPGYKLVPKRATRKWRDEAAAKAYFGNAPEFYTEPGLKTPAQCEKLMDKEEVSKLDALCTKESSGHTLVHESDKRDAIRVDAKAAFA